MLLKRSGKKCLIYTHWKVQIITETTSILISFEGLRIMANNVKKIMNNRNDFRIPRVGNP